MSGLRMLIVSSRYWPQVSESERYLAQLAVEFRRRGHHPTVVSARWCKSWPSRVTDQGIPVIRLANAPSGGWATYRYSRDLARWTRQHREEFDMTLVGSLRHDAYAVMGARLSGPVILAPQWMGADGDCCWQQQTRIGRRIRRRCQSAAAIVASGKAGASELREAGYAESMITKIPAGVKAAPTRSAERQHRARQALAAVNHDLELIGVSPLVVCVERLARGRGVDDLILAWRQVGQRYPSARMWIVGDGPDRQRVYERIVDHELHHQVFLPGSFDQVDELFQAADIYVAPSTDTEARPATMSAMAAGLPVVAVATPDNRAMIEAGTHGFLVPPVSSQALSSALCQLLESTATRVQFGQAGRDRVLRQFSLNETADQYIDLFSRLVGNGR